MMIASDFVRAPSARCVAVQQARWLIVRRRDGEFSTSGEDQPLVAQFAANNAMDLALAAQLVRPYVDAVDVNCGCPQRWVMAEGYGSALLTKPQLVRDMVRLTAELAAVPVSVKVRIDERGVAHTVDLCRQLEAAGVAWLTVHGRTPRTKSTQPASWDAIRTVREALRLPVLANGDVFSLADARALAARTGVHGAMAARGLLANPALYLGHPCTPPECAMDLVDLSVRAGTPFKTLHSHLMMMLFDVHTRAEKAEFNALRSTAALVDFFRHHKRLEPGPHAPFPYAPPTSPPEP